MRVRRVAASSPPRVAAPALVLALLAVCGGCGDGSPGAAPSPTPSPAASEATGLPGGGTATAATWTRVAPSPLAPRRQPAAAWTGREVVVFGGSTPDCRRARCRTAAAREGRDAAAYDPAANSWRRLAPLPVRVESPLQGAVVVGRTVYALSFTSDDSAFVAYDLDADRWRRLGLPPGRIPVSRLSATGDGRLVLAGVDHKGPDERDWVYDAATGRWSRLPADPFGVAYNRWTLGVPGGGLVLLAVQKPADPDRVPALYGAARLARGAAEWTALPNSTVAVNIQVWWAVGDRVVSPLGGALGPDVFTSGPAAGELASRPDTGGYPYGGILDVTAGRWDALPEPVPPYPYGGTDPFGWAQAAGAETVVSGAHALHVPSGRWVDLAGAPAGVRGLSEAAVTWAGDRLFVWGGRPPGAGGASRGSAMGWTWKAEGLR